MILPGMSGPEILARLKADPATNHIPVIVLSSLTEKNRLKLMEAGAADYIEKSSLEPSNGVNRLPEILQGMMARIQQNPETAPRDPCANRP